MLTYFSGKILGEMCAKEDHTNDVLCANNYEGFQIGMIYECVTVVSIVCWPSIRIP
jgi:hypothetical protein